MSAKKKNAQKIIDSIEKTRQELKEHGWNDNYPHVPCPIAPKEIWLQPWCAECELEYVEGDDDRFWSEVDHGPCELCGAVSIHYLKEEVK